ncbi:MAG TPA: plastocyanin/azurin family copper-binding protein [Candidatus Rubrimentiphilum sp.]|nr:plastocyanin/azurin family copper-binding protein [Candidatus Rubrimentiphilum sp.]
MKRIFQLLGALTLVACTNGGIIAQTSGNADQTVDVNLTLDPVARTSAGSGGGYAPVVMTVTVGTRIRFLNSDSFAHTATLIPSATSFPAGSPFTVSAQTQSGSMLSQSWSSGTLAAGASSQTLTVDRAGTYLYGCFFHYGAPMRGMIVAN